jgi:hypothetical protein
MATSSEDLGRRHGAGGEAATLDQALPDTLVKGNFQKCVDIVIGLEGGDRIISDLGGATRWGISGRSHPGIDIQNLTRDEAVALYRKEYWDECRCEALPWPMDLVVFDTAVNQGPSYARGMTTGTTDYAEVLLRRVERYTDIAERHPATREYFRGWINRIVKLCRIILKDKEAR